MKNNKTSTTLWLESELLQATDDTLEMLDTQLGWKLSRHGLMKRLIEDGLENFNESSHAQIVRLTQVQPGSD